MSVDGSDKQTAVFVTGVIVTAVLCFYLFLLRGQSGMVSDNPFVLCGGQCSCTYQQKANLTISMPHAKGGMVNQRRRLTTVGNLQFNVVKLTVNGSQNLLSVNFSNFSIGTKKISSSGKVIEETNEPVRIVPDDATVTPPTSTTFEFQNVSFISGDNRTEGLSPSELLKKSTFVPRVEEKSRGLEYNPFSFQLDYGLVTKTFYPDHESEEIANMKKSILAQLQIGCPLVSRAEPYSFYENGTDFNMITHYYVSDFDEKHLTVRKIVDHTKALQKKTVEINFKITKEGQLVEASASGEGSGIVGGIGTEQSQDAEGGVDDVPTAGVRLEGSFKCTPNSPESVNGNDDSVLRRLTSFFFGRSSQRKQGLQEEEGKEESEYHHRKLVADHWGDDNFHHTDIHVSTIDEVDTTHRHLAEQLESHIDDFMAHPIRLDSAASAALILTQFPLLFNTVIKKKWKSGHYEHHKLGRIVLYGVLCASEVPDATVFLQNLLTSEKYDDEEKAQMRAEIQCLQTVIPSKTTSSSSRPDLGRLLSNVKIQTNNPSSGPKICSDKCYEDTKIGTIEIPKDTSACDGQGACKVEDYDSNELYGNVEDTLNIKRVFEKSQMNSFVSTYFQQGWHLKRVDSSQNDPRWLSGDKAGGKNGVQLMQGQRVGLVLFNKWQLDLIELFGGVRTLNTWTTHPHGPTIGLNETDHGVFSMFKVFGIDVAGSLGHGGWMPFQWYLGLDQFSTSGGQTTSQFQHAHCEATHTISSDLQHCTQTLQCPNFNNIMVCQGDSDNPSWSSTPCVYRQYLDSGGWQNRNVLYSPAMEAAMAIFGALKGGEDACEQVGNTFKAKAMCRSSCPDIVSQYGLECGASFSFDNVPSKLGAGFEIGISLSSVIKLALNVAVGGGTPVVGKTVGWAVDKFHMYRQTKCAGANDLKKLYDRLESNVGISLYGDFTVQLFLVHFGFSVEVAVIEGFLSVSGVADSRGLQNYYSGGGGRSGRSVGILSYAIGISIWYPCRCKWWRPSCKSCYWTKWFIKQDGLDLWRTEGITWSGNHQTLQPMKNALFDGSDWNEFIIYLWTKRRSRELSMYIEDSEFSSSRYRNYRLYMSRTEASEDSDLVLKNHRGNGFHRIKLMVFGRKKGSNSPFKQILNYQASRRKAFTVRFQLKTNGRRLHEDGTQYRHLTNTTDDDATIDDLTNAAEELQSEGGVGKLQAQLNQEKFTGPKTCQRPEFCDLGKLSKDGCHCNAKVEESCGSVDRCVHGDCIDLKCACDPGFVGPTCSEESSTSGGAANVTSHNNDVVHSSSLWRKVASIRASKELCLKNQPCGVGKLVDGKHTTMYMGTGFNYSAMVTFKSPQTITRVTLSRCKGFNMNGDVRIMTWNGTSSWRIMYTGPFENHGITPVVNNVSERGISLQNVWSVRVDGLVPGGLWCLTEFQIDGYDEIGQKTWNSSYKQHFDCPGKSRGSTCQHLKDVLFSHEKSLRERLTSTKTIFQQIGGDELKELDPEVFTSLKTMKYMTADQLKAIRDILKSMSANQLNATLERIDPGVVLAALPKLDDQCNSTNDSPFSWDKKSAELLLEKVNIAKNISQLRSLRGLLSAIDATQLMGLAESDLVNLAPCLTRAHVRGLTEKLLTLNTTNLGSLLRQLKSDQLWSTIQQLSYDADGVSAKVMLDELKAKGFIPQDLKKLSAKHVYDMAALVAFLSKEDAAEISDEAYSGLTPAAARLLEAEQIVGWSKARFDSLSTDAKNSIYGKRLRLLNATQKKSLLCVNITNCTTHCPKFVVDFEYQFPKQFDELTNPIDVIDEAIDTKIDALRKRVYKKQQSPAEKNSCDLRMLRYDVGESSVTSALRFATSDEQQAEQFASMMKDETNITSVQMIKREENPLNSNGFLLIIVITVGIIATMSAIVFLIFVVIGQPSGHFHMREDDTVIELKEKSKKETSTAVTSKV